MEKGVSRYGEYDGEQSEPIRVDRDRESQTRVKKHAEKKPRKFGFQQLSLVVGRVHAAARTADLEVQCVIAWALGCSADERARMCGAEAWRRSRYAT